ncbi:unnamed protein product, partial [Phaeothamnion confervicola]
GYDLSAIITIKQPDSQKILVLCHGLLASKQSLAYISSLLEFNTCRFDFGGNGESGGEWTYGGYEREVSDVRAVVGHLRSEGWEIAAILGHSKGAAAVLQYAEHYDGDVPFIFNLAGRFDTKQTPRARFSEEQWGQLEGEGAFTWSVRGCSYRVTKQAFAERAALDMVRTSKAIQRSAVHTIHGTNDEIIPVEDAHKFAKLIADHSLDIVEGGSHSFATPPEKEHVVAAISRRLGLTSSAS